MHPHSCTVLVDTVLVYTSLVHRPAFPPSPTVACESSPFYLTDGSCLALPAIPIPGWSLNPIWDFRRFLKR